MNSFAETGSFSIGFLNEHVVYERIVTCTVKDYEFNYSYNPTLVVSQSTGQLQSFATCSIFHPYVTSVGLYNDNNDLLAVAKLVYPVPMSPDTDMTFVIKQDL